MITPSPTTKIEPGLSRGTLGQVISEGVKRPELITLKVHNTSYELYLVPAGPTPREPGARLLGVIRVNSRRIDVVGTGGKFIDPVMGRPRRVQGVVIGHRDTALIVDAGGIALHCTPTDPRQQAQQFEKGQLVSCDVMDGATFSAA